MVKKEMVKKSPRYNTGGTTKAAMGSAYKNAMKTGRLGIGFGGPAPKQKTSVATKKKSPAISVGNAGRY